MSRFISLSSTSRIFAISLPDVPYGFIFDSTEGEYIGFPDTDTMRYAAGTRAHERRPAACLGSDLRRYSRGPRPGGPVDGPGLLARENVIKPAQVLRYIMRIVVIH
jgi:hypothetical protein